MVLNLHKDDLVPYISYKEFKLKNSTYNSNLLFWQIEYVLEYI